jgi:hypothetical protein
MKKKQAKKPKEEKKRKEKRPEIMNPDTRSQMVWKPFGR